MDTQLGLTTLEEVFLKIAQLAELESSSTEENLVTLNLSSGSSIQVRICTAEFEDIVLKLYFWLHELIKPINLLSYASCHRVIRRIENKNDNAALVIDSKPVIEKFLWHSWKYEIDSIRWL